MKYRPEFPERFGCLQDTRGFCGEFFHWYNDEHHHSGLGYLTPFAVHFGQAHEQREQRALCYGVPMREIPGRFVRGLPQPLALPEQVWINKPNEVGSGNDSKSISAVSLLVGTTGPKNGFHNWLITNERESGKAPGSLGTLTDQLEFWRSEQTLVRSCKACKAWVLRICMGSNCNPML